MNCQIQSFEIGLDSWIPGRTYDVDLSVFIHETMPSFPMTTTTYILLILSVSSLVVALLAIQLGSEWQGVLF